MIKKKKVKLNRILKFNLEKIMMMKKMIMKIIIRKKIISFIDIEDDKKMMKL